MTDAIAPVDGSSSELQLPPVLDQAIVEELVVKIRDCLSKDSKCVLDAEQVDVVGAQAAQVFLSAVNTSDGFRIKNPSINLVNDLTKLGVIDPLMDRLDF